MLCGPATATSCDAQVAATQLAPVNIRKLRREVGPIFNFDLFRRGILREVVSNTDLDRRLVGATSTLLPSLSEVIIFRVSALRVLSS